jgi:hypothetical protein
MPFCKLIKGRAVARRADELTIDLVRMPVRHRQAFPLLREGY